MRRELENAAAEIDAPRAFDEQRWRDDGAGPRLAKLGLEPCAVIRTAQRERSGKPGVADESGLVFEKRACPEYVVGMGVREDHVANGQRSVHANGRAQRLSVLGAAASVHRRDAVPADDEADVGNGTAVCGIGVFVPAAADEESARDFDELRKGGGGAGSR